MDSERYTFSGEKMDRHSRDAKLLIYKVLAALTGGVVLWILDTGLAVWAVAGLAVIVAVVFCVLYWRKRQYIAQLLTSGEYQSGEILDITYQHYGKLADSPRVTFRYIANEAWQETSSYVPFNWVEARDEDDVRVDLVIDPEKPEKAFIADLYGETVENL